MEVSRSHHWVILFAAILIALYTLLRIFFSSSLEKDQETNLTEPIHEVAVEIRGMVSKPGIYFLLKDSSLNDLLEKAELTLPKGILSHWQRDLPLQAGSLITVEEDGMGGVAISIRKMEARKLFFLNLPIDVNAASARDLMVIPGIGPKTARAIVSYRNRRGAFSRIADLEDVPGVGAKRLDSFSRYLTVTTE